MTATFSFPRLLQLIRKHWVENSKLYLFSSLALLGLLALMFTFWLATSGTRYQEDNAYLMFIGGIYIAGAVFASMSFNALGDKPKATYWLSFPASHLEKLVTVVFYSTVVFTLIYCACFFVVKSAADLYIENMVQRFPDRYSYRQVDFGSDFGSMFRISMYGFFAVQAFYLLGSIYFSRYSFVITTIFGALIIFLFVYYMSRLFFDSFNEQYQWQGWRMIEMGNNNTPGSTYKSYELSPFVKSMLGYAVKFVWVPVFWLITWFRLKEKQV